MAVSIEWSQVESSMEDIAPPSSNDLFDGDILGDELMDIYNAAVVGGGDDDDEVMNEIPGLLSSSDLATDDKKDGSEDDGFGAFRPSTSFNNLTLMLEEPNDDAKSEVIAPTVEALSNAEPTVHSARVVSSTSLSPDLVIAPAASGVAAAPMATSPNGTKRKIVTPKTMSSEPPLKRRSPGSEFKSKQPTKGPANKKASKKKAPNPLSLPIMSNSPISAVRTTSFPSLKIEPVATISLNTGPPPLSANTIAVKQEPGVSMPAVSSAHTVVTTTAPQATISSAPAVVAAASAAILSNPPTEADFKSVAQAAVNSLIMNAGTDTKTNAKTNATKTTKGRSNSIPASSSSSSIKSTSTLTAKRVDTSTEHVKALTGSNWVAVCGGAGTVGDSNINQNNSDKMCNRARRSNLTPDERARQNRDRNREHARNTRLRKKAYVEELKATLSSLVSQRDAAELEKRHTSQRELEQREVRFRVLEEFLKLRGRNEANVARWKAILDSTFTLTLPVVNFREMVHSNDINHRNANALHEQVLTGVPEVMKDSTLSSAFLQNLGKQGNSEMISMAHNCDRHNFFMDNCVAMLDWTATTHGASEQGIELIVKGNIRAKFCPASNKLLSVVMSFDTGAIVSQVNLMNKVKESSEAEAAAAAAQVAANEADALLDSLQMPHFEPHSAAIQKINLIQPCSRRTSGDSANRHEEKAVISSDDERHCKDEVEDDQTLF